MMDQIEFGLFDWVDRGQRPLHQLYEERLQLIEVADVAGFYSYHLAEHHATPLGMAPSPALFLTAAAQRLPRAQALARTNNAGYCHQAGGALLKHLFDGLVWHGLTYRSLNYLLRTTREHWSGEPEENAQARVGVT
ncbi:MAG: hypothetical protein J4N78_16290, partial [Chloroflexi bacterium]|nr:hypothetical protein [Chloroflexota bacterium]